MPRDYGAIVTLIIDCQRRDKETPQNHLALSHFITFYYKFSKVAKLLDLSKLIDPISGLSTGADMTGESLFWYGAKEHNKGENIIQAIRWYIINTKQKEEGGKPNKKRKERLY